MDWPRTAPRRTLASAATDSGWVPAPCKASSRCDQRVRLPFACDVRLRDAMQPTAARTGGHPYGSTSAIACDFTLALSEGNGSTLVITTRSSIDTTSQLMLLSLTHRYAPAPTPGS